MRARIATVLLCVALALFAYVVVVNAWVVDDAYITFRSVENLLHGYGPTWNVDERVQAYTHALWFLVMSAAYAITSEMFYTSLALSVLFTCAAFAIASRTIAAAGVDRRWKTALLALALVASKAFIDYTTSGLENALSYAIAGAFCARMFSGRLSGRWRDCVLLTSLAYLNRPDSVVILLPALAYAFIQERHTGYGRLIAQAALASLPALAWTAFALVYYGFPFPNTAYAKSLTTGLPWSWRIERGLEYTSNSLQWDTASYAMLLAAGVFAVRRRSPVAAALMAGVLLYVVAIVLDFASTTHMSGRFFALPFFVSIVVLVRQLQSRVVAAAAAALLVAYIAWSPVSSIKFGTGYYRALEQRSSYIDTKWFVANEGAALVSWRPGRTLPDHPWFHNGLQVRALAEKVHLGGALGGHGIGYLGFAAGPDKFIIDVMALSDPLLARLPMMPPASSRRWQSGHFQRKLPDGYIESVAADANLIVDPDVRAFYSAIRTITRAPLFRWERFRIIARINLGLIPAPARY